MPYQLSVISEKGRRFTMEDAHFMDSNFNNTGWIYGGVYDGHTSDFAANYAAGTVNQEFLNRITSGMDAGTAFTESYHEVSRQIGEERSGTCAADFLIRDRQIDYANAGDTRIIVVTKDSVIQLTTDHRMSDPYEERRISELGYPLYGDCLFINNEYLMVTRSIGDARFVPVGLLNRPVVGTYRLNGDELWLINACDGLFDEMTNEEVADFARQYSDPEELINVLKEEVLVHKKGKDNLTIMAVCFPQTAEQAVFLIRKY